MAFNVEKVTSDLVKWLNDWFLENGPGCNAVIGISGGKDSSVTAALCVRALGADRVGTGRFGADMKVRLVNDGPFSLELTA